MTTPTGATYQDWRYLTSSGNGLNPQDIQSRMLWALAYFVINGSGGGGGGSGTINDITSTGGTIAITAPTGPTTNIDLSTSGVSANTYGISTITVNAEGIVTSAANGALTESRTFAVAGAIAVPSGSTNYIPPFFEPVDTNVTKKLVKVRYVIQAGTSVGFNVTQNGSNITGLTGLSATTVAASTTPTPPTVADGDLFAIVVTSATGSPFNLTVSLMFESTI